MPIRDSTRPSSRDSWSWLPAGIRPWRSAGGGRRTHPRIEPQSATSSSVARSNGRSCRPSAASCTWPWRRRCRSHTRWSFIALLHMSRALRRGQLSMPRISPNGPTRRRLRSSTSSACWRSAPRPRTSGRLPCALRKLLLRRINRIARSPWRSGPSLAVSPERIPCRCTSDLDATGVPRVMAKAGSPRSERRSNWQWRRDRGCHLRPAWTARRRSRAWPRPRCSTDCWWTPSAMRTRRSRRRRPSARRAGGSRCTPSRRWG